MTQPSLQPPRWARALIQLALPCDPMRDAILGDLHEEFLGDTRAYGIRLGRVRYLQRTAGIVVRALSDAMIMREWVSTGPAAASQLVVESPQRTQHRVSSAGGFAGFVIIALLVLAVAVVANTILFSATGAHHTHASSAAGIAGVALLLACVGLGALVVCAGPRWRGKRRRDA